MDERISQITSDMQGIADDAAASFGKLTNEQLNWKPAAESWSIAQCLDHLIRSNVEFDGDWPRLHAKTRKNSFLENWSPLTGFWGWLLIDSMKKDSRKVKAPSKSIVPPSEIEAGIVERFVSNIEQTNRNLTGCDGVDLRRTVLTSPFMSLVTYRLDDALTMLVEHSKRHIRQAKRVMEAEAFPAAAEPATNA